MKQRWLAFAARIDALTLRERVLLFATTSALIVCAAYFTALGPMFKHYAALRGQLNQQQNNLAGMDGEITQKIQEFQRDPDAAARERLATVQAESAKLGDSLRAMQKGLVPPEQMASLVDTILRANGRLKLVSMRTLPVSPLSEQPAAKSAAVDAPPVASHGSGAKPALTAANVQSALAARSLGPSLDAAASRKPPAPAAARPGSLLYRHGVEIAVRGNYLDMIDYMNALEALPTQLFWGGARLEVEDYPSSRLTLTLYTLSLDSKWMKL